MAIFKSGNPALDKETFTHCDKATNQNIMTIEGTVNKTALLLLVTFVSALATWHLFFNSYDVQLIKLIVLIGSIIGLAIAFFIAFNKDLASYLVFFYAISEGLALGGLSAFMENSFPGIVVQSLALTFTIFVSLLVIYKLRLIKVTENFKLIVASSTSGIALYYLASLTANIWGVDFPLVHENTTGGILFSAFVAILASVNLVVDFDFIEQGADNKVPKYMEWYGAFGLLVTVIWLYIEILRILAKSRRK